MPQMGAVEFASVLAAAAPFGDRLRGRYFAPTGEPDPAVLAAWARAAGADRTDLLDAALVLLGLTQAQLAAGLAPVRLRGAESLVATAGMATIPEELLPSWGLALRDFLHAVGSAPLDGWHVPVGPIFTDVWVRACSAALVLMDDAVAEWVVPLEDKARRDLAMSLARRIAYATRRAMEPEALVATALGLSPADGVPGTPEGWLQRLRDLPGLAYPLGLAVHHWREGIRTLATRLAADVDDVARLAGLSDRPTEIIRMRPDAGDPHEKGQSVTLIDFGGGAGVAYKPKPQDSALAMAHIAGLLNAHPALASRGICLPVRGHLACDGYGWDRLVVPTDGTAGDAQVWGRAYGAIVRVFELVEAGDMWLDNVILSGSEPHLIDVETMLQPRHFGVSPARALLAETCWPTGSVTSPLVLPGGEVDDIGTLSPPRTLRMPFRGAEFGDRWAPTAGPTADDGLVPWSVADWRPRTDDADALIAAVLEGHAAAEEAITDPGIHDDLAAALGDLGRAPGRVVLRSTFTCYRLMFGSLAPDVLVGGTAREIHLAQFLRPSMSLLAAPDPATRAYAERMVRVGHADRQAIEVLDIPLVRHDPTTDAVRLSDATVVDGWFDGVPLERALARLQTAPATFELRQGVLRAAARTAASAALPADDREAVRTAAVEQVQQLLVNYGVHPDDARDAVAGIRS